MSDSSYPHRPDDASPDGAQVLEFPSDEVSSPSRPVPAGTWASDEADAAQSTQRPVRRPDGGGQVVAFPRPTLTQKRRRADPSEAEEAAQEPIHAAPRSTSEPAAIAPPALEDLPEGVEVPKYLATELLREDWQPVAPLERTLRWGAAVLGGLGVLGAVALGGVEPQAIGYAVVFALCAAAGIAPLSGPGRGVALSVLGIAGVGLVSYGQVAHHEVHAGPLLLGCVAVAASALWFRAAHRRSRFARALVAVGIAGGLAWLVLSGGIDALVIASFEWQAWVDPTLRLLLLVTLLGGLLSFVDPNGDGGAWLSGSVLLGWLAVHALGVLTLQVFPARPGGALSPDEVVSTALIPLFVAIATGGLCQLWALISRVAHERAAAEA